MCCFCHAQLFEITRAKNIKSPLVQRSCQNAEVVQAFCRVAASRSNTPSINSPAVRCCTDIARRLMLASRLPSRAAPPSNPHSAPQLSRCPTSRDFVPWRFLDAGQLSARVFHCCRRPKTSTQTDSCAAAKPHHYSITSSARVSNVGGRSIRAPWRLSG